MIAKKTFYKLYFKLICLSLVIFLSISNLAMSAVLTEEELKYIEEQSEESKDDGDEYIKYEDIKEQKTKKNPFIFLAQKRKKQKKKFKKKKV